MFSKCNFLYFLKDGEDQILAVSTHKTFAEVLFSLKENFFFSFF